MSRRRDVGLLLFAGLSVVTTLLCFLGVASLVTRPHAWLTALAVSGVWLVVCACFWVSWYLDGWSRWQRRVHRQRRAELLALRYGYPTRRAIRREEAAAQAAFLGDITEGARGQPLPPPPPPEPVAQPRPQAGPAEPPRAEDWLLDQTGREAIRRFVAGRPGRDEGHFGPQAPRPPRAGGPEAPFPREPDELPLAELQRDPYATPEPPEDWSSISQELPALAAELARLRAQHAATRDPGATQPGRRRPPPPADSA